MACAFLGNNIKIMGIISYIVNRILGSVHVPQYDDSAIADTARNTPNIISETSRTQIKAIIDEIHQVYSAANCKDFTIGLIGDFTVGKSSFVNAILGKKIVPVSANPSTAIITKIKYGRKPKVIVHYNNIDEIEMTYEEFFDFSAFNLDDFRERERTGEIQRLKNVTDATVYVKSDFLKENNLCIIDTLGLSSHESDNLKTIASLKDAIALIYVCDERGLSIKDVDFISTYLNLERGDLFFCINRIDLVKKSDREKLTNLVKLKLDDILHKTGCRDEYPIARIYQVSALYQNFANGFIDHENWREDVDYQSRSGFSPLLNDICEYVKDNVSSAKKRAINKQLETASIQIASVKSYRESEISAKIKTLESDIKRFTEDIKRLKEKVAYKKSLFDNLEQSIYSLLPDLFSKYSKEVDNHWNYACTFQLMDKVSFGFTDYMKLEKDIFALKLNVFKSMSDSRYARLDSLSPFVNLTLQYLQETLQPLLYNVSSEISRLVEDFIERYLMKELFENEVDLNSCILSNNPVVVYDNIKNPMYRAVAVTATETAWMKNSNRKRKMFDAAKDEALKSMEKPFKESVEIKFREIQQTLNILYHNYVKPDMNTIQKLEQDKKEKESYISRLQREWNDESVYYNEIKNVIVEAQL